MIFQNQALQFKVFRSAVLCCVRAAGPVRPGQCRGGRPHEAPGGDPQAGEGGGGGGVAWKYSRIIFLQVKFEDLFLIQCFNLVFLQFKERLLTLVGRDLNRRSLKLKQDLTLKIETYFD